MKRTLIIVVLIILLSTVYLVLTQGKTVGPLTQEEAIFLAQGTSPDLAGYPSDNLPPKRIEAEATSQGWNVGFLTYGSGLPGILQAVCYSVSNSGEVTKTGTYSRGAGEAADRLNLATCRP